MFRTIIFFSIIAASLAAECGSKTLNDVADSATFAASNYEDNWWRARQAMCGVADPCFDGSVSCSVQVVIDDKSTLKLSRSAQDATPNFSSCWDAIENIITQCVRGENKAEGSWTLSSGAYQYTIITTSNEPELGVSPNDLDQTPLGPVKAPSCSDCGSGGDSEGKCNGGFFDGEFCCGSKAGPCDDNNCQGVNGACTQDYLGCSCRGGKSAPTGTPTDCNSDCCGTVLDASWCLANCKGFFNTDCGLCVCGR